MSADVLSHLGRTGRNRTVLQGFTPLASSLEWELGAQYLAKRGSQAFLSDPVPVPYAVNNSGFLVSVRRTGDQHRVVEDLASS